MNISFSCSVILHVHLIRQTIIKGEYSGCYFTYCHIHNLCAHSSVSLAPSPPGFLPPLALSYVVLPLCVLACVCTVTFCGNTSMLKEKGRGGGVWSSGARYYLFCLSLCQKKRTAGRRRGAGGVKNNRAGSERAVYGTDSRDAEGYATNKKSHLNCRPLSRAASLLPPARFELLTNCWR